MSQELSFFHDSAREITRIAGDTAARMFRSGVAVETKTDTSPVTEADRAAERAARAAIFHRFPDHSILGEELGGEMSTSGWQWIVDPIDGTKSFVRGVPLFTTLVALCRDGQPVVGVIYNPVTGEMASAYQGGGAFDERGRTIRCGTTAELSAAWVALTDPVTISRLHPAATATLLHSACEMRTWADAYGYLLLARGDMDVMIDPIVNPWDVAPLSVIVREAGGVFSRLSGEIDDLGADCIASCTADLHAAVVRAFRAG